MSVVRSALSGLVRPLVSLAVLGSVAAVSHAEPDAAATIKATLQDRYKEISVQDVRPSQIPGLYEVYVGGKIVYSDRTGDYLVLGKVVDTKTRQDLTALALDARSGIDFQKLPFEHAIKLVKGNGARQLAIFEDPDCPYCQQLEQALRDLNDVTVYVFLYPLENVHPSARVHARAIWCSPDRGAAWTDWMTGHKEPPQKACDHDPLDANLELGTSLRVNSTPTMFLQSGRRIAGAVSASQLQEFLGASGQEKVAAPGKGG